MPIDTKGFLDICRALPARRARMFVRIYNARTGITKAELAEAMLLLRLGPVQYIDLRELQADGLIECQDHRYYATRLVRQLVREIQQNQRIKKHLGLAQPYGVVVQKALVSHKEP